MSSLHRFALNEQNFNYSSRHSTSLRLFSSFFFFFFAWNSRSPAVTVKFQRTGRYYWFFFSKKRWLSLGKVWILDYRVFLLPTSNSFVSKCRWLILLLTSIEYKYWKIIDLSFLLESKLCITNSTNEAEGLIQIYTDARGKRTCLWSS